MADEIKIHVDGEVGEKWLRAPRQRMEKREATSDGDAMDIPMGNSPGGT